ncbi:hypothetical protein CEQ90_09095 [Lewinellaceae bacterium SD302]|nr:hypothetical protein CEQ90_09095 [Lewinellaceae bacterium SD302]
MKNCILGIMLILGFSANSLFAQFDSNLHIDTSIPIELMVEDFFSNPCVDVTNVSFQGDSSSYGFYLAPETNLGINGGILLTTGGAIEVADSSVAFTAISTNSTAQDANLNDIVELTDDVAILEFDLESFSDDTVTIVYVFGSEEYPEYVCSDFNDVFGFFVSGPAPDGTELINKNIAMVPELDGNGYTDLAVAINSLNSGVPGSLGGTGENCQAPIGSLDFSDYYVDNESTINPDIIYDGMTTVLQAPLVLVEGGIYHIKISIADALDSSHDSGVFLGTASFCGDSLITPVADFTPSIVDGVLSIENNSRYATDFTIDYGNGHVEQTTNPEPYAYPVSGTFTVTMTAENFCCSDSEVFEVEATVVNVDEQLASSLTISPNPVQNLLFVYQSSNVSRELDCQIFDSFGRLVSQQKKSANGSIDVGELPVGLYYLRVNSEERTATKKFYKQ